MPKQAGKIEPDRIRLNVSLPKRAATSSSVPPKPALAPKAAAVANPRSNLLPGGWWFWCLIGLSIGLGTWFGGRQYLRFELAAQLASTDNEQLALESIEGLLRLDGDASIEVARGLAHPKFMVANSAFRSLNQQLDRWRKLEADVHLKRIADIAAELEKIPGDLDQDHKILVSGLASRVYSETLGLKADGTAEVLERCKRLMSLSPAPLPPASSIGSIQELAAPIEPPDLPRAQATENSISDLETYDPVPPPLAPLQTSLPATPQPPEPTSSEPILAAQPASPAGMPTMGKTPISTGRTTVHLTATAPEPSIAESTARGKLSDASNDSSQSQPLDHEDDQPTVEVLSGVEQMSIDQLVRLLSSVQPRIAQAAALALSRKGMSDEKLTMAIHLATGSTQERMELLGSIAGRDDLDPRPWLLWMAADGDERVREHAVGLLNPMLDNDIRRQLRLLLNRERDERVAQTLRKVLAR